MEKKKYSINFIAFILKHSWIDKNSNYSEETNKKISTEAQELFSLNLVVISLVHTMPCNH